MVLGPVQSHEKKSTRAPRSTSPTPSKARTRGSFDNQWLKQAMVYQVPLIYFFGVAPGRYEALYPGISSKDWSAATPFRASGG